MIITIIYNNIKILTVSKSNETFVLIVQLFETFSILNSPLFPEQKFSPEISSAMKRGNPEKRIKIQKYRLPLILVIIINFKINDIYLHRQLVS